jgi:hypothetical protein
MKKLAIFLVLFSALSLIVHADPLDVLTSADGGSYTKEQYKDRSEGCSWYCCAPRIEVSASSVLPDQENFSYKAKHVHDFSLDTSWVEGDKGDGIGESLLFLFKALKERGQPELALTGFTMVNGLIKTDKIWRANSRVKVLKMYIDNKPKYIINFPDSPHFQNVSFDPIHFNPDKDMLLKLEIAEVYRGEKYSDTAISEINFLGKGCRH